MQFTRLHSVHWSQKPQMWLTIFEYVVEVTNSIYFVFVLFDLFSFMKYEIQNINGVLKAAIKVCEHFLSLLNNSTCVVTRKEVTKTFKYHILFPSEMFVWYAHIKVDSAGIWDMAYADLLAYGHFQGTSANNVRGKTNYFIKLICSAAANQNQAAVSRKLYWNFFPLLASLLSLLLGRGFMHYDSDHVASQRSFFVFEWVRCPMLCFVS